MFHKLRVCLEILYKKEFAIKGSESICICHREKHALLAIYIALDR